MNWLCIEVRYLFNKYHGSRDGGRRTEYPPSSHRLFQALNAAANNNGKMPDAAKAALQWLEKQSSPLIIAPLFRGMALSRKARLRPIDDQARTA